MVMTGHGKQYSAESAIAAGAGDFIEKPFSIDEFVLRLYKMIRDSEIRCQMEAKQNEMKTKQTEMEMKQNEIAFHLSRRSSEEINDLKREIESLKSQLSSVYSRSL
jgi:FixJ family two-component response regulator